MTRVLVVEDDPKIKAEMTFILRGEGWSPTAVETAEQALERLGGSDPPDLLVVDVLVRGLREARRGTNIEHSRRQDPLNR